MPRHEWASVDPEAKAQVESIAEYHNIIQQLFKIGFADAMSNDGTFQVDGTKAVKEGHSLYLLIVT